MDDGGVTGWGLGTPEPDWLSWPEVAEFVGCPVSTIGWYVRQGRIEHRPAKGQRPSQAGSCGSARPSASLQAARLATVQIAGWATAPL